MIEDLFAESVDHHGNGVLRTDAAGLAVKELVLADLGGGRLMFHRSRMIAHVDIGEVWAPQKVPMSSETQWG